MTTLAFVQARMGSTRLPGKILLALGTTTMLELVVRRLGASLRLDGVVVVTSQSPQDEPVVAFCRERGLRIFRGSESDVLDRFYQAALVELPDVVVRITADCPLIDPTIVDKVIEAREARRADYASNTLPPTYPDGLDVEAFTTDALFRAWREATSRVDREHVTPYIRHSDAFSRTGIRHNQDLSGLRWTVDDASDLHFIEQVLRHLPEPFNARLPEVLRVLNSHPEVRAMQPTTIANEGYYKSLYSAAPGKRAELPTLTRSRELHERAVRVIPGASQTFSKAHNQYVNGTAPIFLEEGHGAYVWDVDRNKYIDYVQALLPNILGYANEDVNAAAIKQLGRGNSFSLPHPLEVELAERLTTIIPCAEMVRFAKNGSDVTAASVRVARAFTGRDHIACCGYHGWQDWFIGSTTRNAGVPQAVRDLVHAFPYNDLEKLDHTLKQHKGQFAAIIMEPVNFYTPAPGYLEGVRHLADTHGALLIFDEICSGFHFGLGGAQRQFGVTPDLGCFGKAMGNGFPIAALVGRRDIMMTCQEIFFSSTFGGEAASLAAALKVLDILENTDALALMGLRGKRLMEGFNALSALSGLSRQLECVGYPRWSLLKFRDESGADSMLVRSLFQQEVAKRGILQLVTHNLSAAHDDDVIESTLRTYADVLKLLAGWLREPAPASFLDGPMIEPVFRVRS